MSYVQAHFVESLKDHQLECILNDKKTGISVWNMRRPGTRMYGVQITFSPEGIALQGDVVYGPGGGLTSTCGYGLGWFSGYLSEDYLCEKFLQKQWVAEYAAEELEEELKNPEDYAIDEKMIEPLKNIISQLGEVIETGTQLWEALDDIDYCIDDGPPGWGYGPVEAMALCSVQQKFAELYKLRKKDRNPRWWRK